MAVSVVSSPPVSPFVLSPSYPTVIEVASTVYGGAGITQFRYVAEVTGLIDLGIKYTVPSDPFTDNGFFDVADLFKLLLILGENQWNGGSAGTDPITQISAPLQQENYVQWTFQVVIKEQYYNSGVFTTNTGPTLTFTASRGYTDKTDSEWFYANYMDLSALSSINNFLTYSGKHWQVLAIKAKDSSWTDTTTHPFLIINSIILDNAGGFINNYTESFTRDTLGYQGVVYLPLRRPGDTDRDDFGEIQIQVYTNSIASIGGGTLVLSYTIQKTVGDCQDEQLIMFQDRFLQWSFMSFNKYRRDTVNTEGQSAEATSGRFRYNVKSSDTLTMNTDFLPDETNELVRDLITTEKCFLVDPDDGSLEQVTVVPNTLRIQESTVDGLHQYQMSFRKSVDNFRP